MGKIARELTSNPNKAEKCGSHCTVCNPYPKDRITHSQVWSYSLATGLQPLKENIHA